MDNHYTPYTYLIGWSHLDLWYYGVEIKTQNGGANPKNLWTTYFTSSKRVAAMRKELGEPDIIQVRRTFSCRKAAVRWEQLVLHRMGVVRSKKWLNLAVASFQDFTCDTESRLKIVKTRRASGKPWHSMETRSKIGSSKIGKVLDLSDSERKRRGRMFSSKNKDEEFLSKRKLGIAAMMAVPGKRERLSNKMRETVLNPKHKEKRIAAMRTPEHRLLRKISSTKQWPDVEDSMRRGHKMFREDPVRKEEHRQHTIRMHQARRGWKFVLVGDKKFETITECAAFLGKSKGVVVLKIKSGELITLAE